MSYHDNGNSTTGLAENQKLIWCSQLKKGLVYNYKSIHPYYVQYVLQVTESATAATLHFYLPHNSELALHSFIVSIKQSTYYNL